MNRILDLALETAIFLSIAGLTAAIVVLFPF